MTSAVIQALPVVAQAVLEVSDTFELSSRTLLQNHTQKSNIYVFKSVNPFLLVKGNSGKL